MDNQPNHMRRESLTTILREKELWILVILGSLYFYRPLFLEETFFFRDIGSNILIHQQLLVEFMEIMELPLWNPYWHGGQPYLANIPYFSLYPSNLLYLVLPFLKAFNVTFISHVIGCSVCIYLFSRVIGLRQISSLIAGIVYGFCGYTLSLVSHGCRILAMPYIPLLFLFWHLFLLEGRKKWFITTIIVGVLQVLTGSSETNAITLISLLGWILFYPYPYLSIFRKSLYWSFLGLFIVGISSFQIIPMIEVILQSSRARGMEYDIFSFWSLPPKRLPELVFPRFLGRIDILPVEIHFWGHKIVDQGIPYILSIYFGWVTVILAIFGGLHKDPLLSPSKGDPYPWPLPGGELPPSAPSKRDKESEPVFPFRVRIFLLVLFACSLVFSLGRFLPFFRVVYQYVPLISLFRHPIKLLTAGIFPVALLVGYTSEIHFGRRPFTSQRNMLVFLWSITGILFVVTGTFLLSDTFTNRFHEFFFNQSGRTPPYPPQWGIAHKGVLYSFLHASAIWLLMTLLYQYRRIKERRWQHWILAGVLAVDLLIAGRPINPSAPEEFFTEEPDLVQMIRHEISDGRLFRTKTSSFDRLRTGSGQASEYTAIAPSDDVVWFYRWNLEILDSYLASFYRFPLIFHSDVNGLAQIYVMGLKSLIDSLPWERRLPLLAAGGVTVILTEEDFSLPGVRRVAEIPYRSHLPLYLYRNETAAARVEFITSWEVVNSNAEAIEVMLDPNYDPRKNVVLQKPEPTLFDLYPRAPEIPTAASHFSKCDGLLHIKKVTSDTHSALFSVSNSCDGYLVFSEPFYPGWKVYVDEKPTPILRANLAFSAVFLPAGEHEVKRQYRPNSLLFGVLSSMLFCMLLCLVMYKKWFFRIHGK